MLLIAWDRHPVLFPDGAEAGQLRGDILADLHGGRDQYGTGNPVESSMSSCARGSRRKIAYLTRPRVVDT
jgi:hypothetical protein